MTPGMSCSGRELARRPGRPTAPILAGSLVATVMLAPAPARAQEGVAEAIAVGYSIPTHAPAGDIQILIPAVLEFAAPEPFGPERFVHVRVAVVNRQDVAEWTLDARELRLVLADGTVVVPGFSAASTGQDNDWLTLSPGGRGYLDVFFPVGALTPTPISFTWLLHHGTQAVVATTVFALLPSGSWEDGRYGAANYVGGELLWGPLWFAPLDTFAGSSPISTSWDTPLHAARGHHFHGRRKWHRDRRYDQGRRWHRDGHGSRRRADRGRGHGARAHGQEGPTRAPPAPPDPDPKPDRTAWRERVKRALPSPSSPALTGPERTQTFNPSDQLLPQGPARRLPSTR